MRRVSHLELELGQVSDGEEVSVRGVFAPDVRGNFGGERARTTRLVVDGEPPLPGHVLEVEGTYRSGQLHASRWRDVGFMAPRAHGRVRVSAYGTPMRSLSRLEKHGAFVHERGDQLLACLLEGCGRYPELSTMLAREVLRRLFAPDAPADAATGDLRPRWDGIDASAIPTEPAEVLRHLGRSLHQVFDSLAHRAFFAVGQLVCVRDSMLTILGEGDTSARKIGPSGVEVLVPDRSIARASGHSIHQFPHIGTSTTFGDAARSEPVSLELAPGVRIALLCGRVEYQEPPGAIAAALRDATSIDALVRALEGPSTPALDRDAGVMVIEAVA